MEPGGNNLKLGKRLKKIVDMAPVVDNACDIGCDHAYASIALAERGKAKRIIACDLRPLPLERAKENIRAAGFSERIETRQGDGLDPVGFRETELALISGMGGDLMMRILGGRAGEFPYLLLSPHSRLRELRVFLSRNAVEILNEGMVEEDGKFYTVLLCGSSPVAWEYADYEYAYGKHLLSRRDPVLYRYLLKERERMEGILPSLPALRFPASFQSSEGLRGTASWSGRDKDPAGDGFMSGESLCSAGSLQCQSSERRINTSSDETAGGTDQAVWTGNVLREGLTETGGAVSPGARKILNEYLLCRKALMQY